FEDRFCLSSICSRLYRVDKEVGSYRVENVRISQLMKDIMISYCLHPKEGRPSWTLGRTEFTRRIFREASIGHIDFRDSQLLPRASDLSMLDTINTYDSVST
ncbi:hypothetical protein PFISCL1PPCAC_3041, partial [Pristionchus fissidentatus]